MIRLKARSTYREWMRIANARNRGDTVQSPQWHDPADDFNTIGRSAKFFAS
jgi:hypothetical protein